MTKEPYGKECKICQRPFTIFRWQPGSKARFKKTEVCQVCAKTKNVCQTCILDLEYGLPVQVRDNALKMSSITQNLPRGNVNREYNQQQLEQAMSTSRDPAAPFGGLEVMGNNSGVSGPGGKIKNNDMLLKLARTEPYYRRNRPHICSFYVKGECKRGEECPFRHEKPTDPEDPLSNQNIKDRFYGMADPVAHKLLDKYRSMPQLVAPEDKSITTLYIGGVPAESIGERELRDRFYQYGELRSVTVYPRQRCAFIQFATREAAERAAEKSYDKLIMAGQRLTVNWGKAQLQSDLMASSSDSHGNSKHGKSTLPGVPGLPPVVMSFPPPPIVYNWPIVTPSHFNAINSAPVILPPPPPPISINNNIGVDSTKLAVHYPSQDPNRFGASTTSKQA